MSSNESGVSEPEVWRGGCASSLRDGPKVGTKGGKAAWSRQAFQLGAVPFLALITSNAGP